MDELKFLSTYRSFFITSHLSPDGDAIGSEIALYFFLKTKGKKAVIVNDEPVPPDYRFLEGSETIQTVADFKRRPRFRDSFEAAVFLECSSKHRAGQAGRLVENVPVLNIDHHFDNNLYGNVNLLMGKTMSFWTALKIGLLLPLPGDILAACLAAWGAYRIGRLQLATLSHLHYRED